MNSQLRNRFETALAEEASLAELARQLQAGGLAQVEVYDCFFSFRQEVLAADRDPQAALLAAVLDRIVGWCAPGERIFAAPLSQAELAEYYASRPAAGQEPAFERAEILARYDRQQRLEVELPGLKKEILPGQLACFTFPGGAGLILHSQLPSDPAAAAESISAQAGRFAQAGLEWTVYAHDRPAGLEQTLASLGFSPGPGLELFFLDLSQAGEALEEPPAADLRPITRPERLEPVLALAQESGQPGGAGRAGLAARLQAGLQSPDSLRVYVGYAQDIPARAAWVHFSPASQFAEISGGPAWAPAPQSAGLDSALLLACLQEAQRQGREYAVVCAAPAARPLLQKFGFQLLDTLRTWASARIEPQ